MKTTIGLILASLVLVGCSPDPAIKRIEKNLGDFQYSGLTPQLDVKVLKRELVKDAYGKKNLKLTGVIQQQGEFPVKEYSVHMMVTVTHKGKSICTAYIQEQIENGSAAFSGTMVMLNSLEEEDVKNTSLEISSFSWYPKKEYKDKVILSIAD